MLRDHDTIVAPATASGGAIAVVRFSGREACALCDRFFRGAAPLTDAGGYSVHFGHIVDGQRIIDEVLATVFRAPHSYTGEDSVEISCHGSSYIVSEILRLAQQAGARMAEPGEFTIRAYLAGKLDLSQAEAVADLIAASSQAEHALAFNQMRGSVKTALAAMQEQLLRLASLLELELDFGEEEVEFADRSELQRIMLQLGTEIDALRDSFALGNAIKEGVPVVIAGAPNVGKSTLLNRLLDDDRALVSDIAGTTRDVIEEQVCIGGVRFRFLDTAGIRATDDRLEQLGIERTRTAIERARIVIRMLTAQEVADGAVPAPDFSLRPDQTLLTVINKIDIRPGFTLADSLALRALADSGSLFAISARDGIGIDALRSAIRSCVDTSALFHGNPVLSNSRHLQALADTRAALDRALSGLHSGLSSELLAEEIRSVISALSAISGSGPITPDHILRNIFSNFCIGK